MPGVGPITALTYVLTIEDPTRFQKSRDVGSFLGLRPRQSQSGKRDPQLGITKAGDRHLRWLLVECAHVLMSKRSPDSQLKRWDLRLCERGGKIAKKRATVAVARKLGVLLHRLWMTGQPYNPFYGSEEPAGGSGGIVVNTFWDRPPKKYLTPTSLLMEATYSGAETLSPFVHRKSARAANLRGVGASPVAAGGPFSARNPGNLFVSPSGRFCVPVV